MKSAKELFERLQTDEEFAARFNDGLLEKRNNGAKNYYETFLPLAEELGYELTREELDATINQGTQELTEEEMGKVAGGTSCIISPIAALTLATGSMALSATFIGSVIALKDAEEGEEEVF